jgi:DNA-binding response OmpR family regulator
VGDPPSDHLRPPRILLVMPEQWPRALLRAALREAGYDASGTLTLEGALYQLAPDPDRGPVQLIVLDQEALGEEEWRRLEELQNRAPEASLLLLAPRTRSLVEGPWATIVQRPTSIAELVGVIERLVPLPPQLRHPIEEQP